MAKYHHVARQVQQLITDRRLRPGDTLPSERQLAGELGVAYGTVRLAYDSLYRAGIIDRHQGKGTFVADPRRDGASPRTGRLGLLAVEMRGHESPYLRSVTFGIQRLARQAGYELIVDQIDMEDLVAGKLPEMILRRSVDGFFTYGRVREHHVRFLDEQPLPYMQVGNRPIPARVPQVTIDADNLAYTLTKELLRSGRSPVWIDVDPANISYETGQQMLRGYSRALAEIGAPLRLCHLNMDRIDQVVTELLATGLKNAAYIVQDWSASLLMSPLTMRSGQARELLLVPIPSDELCQMLRGSNVLRWDRVMTTRDLTEPAVEQLLALIAGKTRRLRSVRLEMDCRWIAPAPEPVMSLRLQRRVYESVGDPATGQPLVPAGHWPDWTGETDHS